MESIIIHVREKSDVKFLAALAKRMGCSLSVLTDEEKEEIGLFHAMEEGRKTKLVPRNFVMKKLRNGKPISR